VSETKVSRQVPFEEVQRTLSNALGSLSREYNGAGGGTEGASSPAKLSTKKAHVKEIRKFLRRPEVILARVAIIGLGVVLKKRVAAKRAAGKQRSFASAEEPVAEQVAPGQ
jgi:hypothetical protein